jgi:hypothetical protein
MYTVSSEKKKDSAMPAHNLTSVLQSLGRRLLTLNLVAGIAWGVTAAIICVLLGVWLDLLWELRPELRIACLVMAGLATVGMVGLLALTAMKRRTPLALARRIDGVAGTGGQIATGVDLLMEHQRFTEVSSGLAKIAVDQAAQKAASVPSGVVVPVKPLWWAAGSAVGMCLLVLILCLLMPGIALAEWLRFTDPYNVHGDHVPFSRIVFDVKPGHAKVLYGSGLDIEVTTSGAPVEKVELVMQAKGAVGEEVLPLFPEPGGKWRATMASVTESGQYHVRAPGGRSEKYRLDVITVPKLEKVSFIITPPAYTQRPAYQGPLPQGGIAGLPSTKVEVRALSNRPLSGGKLELTGPKNEPAGNAEVKPITTNSPEVRAEFTIKQAGKMHLSIRDVDGQDSTDAFIAPITLLTDERPFIRIMEPKEVSFATPDSLLPVQMVAEDDYGISRIQLFCSLNDSRAVPVEVAVKTPPPNYWAAGVTLPLSSYGLRVGDELKFFARVEDNDPAGAKGGESNVVIVRIISQEEFEAMVRQQEGLEVLLSKYQQAQRRMEKLAEEMEKLEKELSEQKPQDGELSKEMQEKMNKLAEEMKKEAGAIKESAKHLLPYDLDKNLNKELEKLGEKVDEAAKEMKKASGQPKMSNKGATEKMKELRKKLAGDQKEFNEKATEPLEHLSKIYPLLEDANRFVELYQQQKDLADRMQSLKGKDKQDDPQLKARMRDLQGEQQRLREELGRLLDDIEKHAQELPDDEKLMELRESAMMFSLEVRGSGASETMQEAEEALGEFSGTKGADKSREAEKILEKFIGKCNGKGGMCEKCEGALKFQPQLNNCMGDTLSQLLGDAGLKPGQGQGQGPGSGSGNGFSSRRGNNVGMYGHMPATGQNMTGGGYGKRNQPANPSANRGGTVTGNQPNGPTATTTPGTVSGRPDINVPPQYRKKTADYFQRLVEDMGGK